MQATQLQSAKLAVIKRENGALRSFKKRVYNPLVQAPAAKVVAPKNSKPLPVFTSMGLVIPFNPCMWDEETIYSAWNSALEMVQKKLRIKYKADYTHPLINRLKKIFNQINFNTHRKSLAIILTPAEEKLIYLNFAVKPVVISGKAVSALDLALNEKREADFNYLVLKENSAVLYEYDSNNLNKVYEKNNESKPDVLFKNTARIIELLNPGYAKPVFVTGVPQQTEAFSKSPYYLKYCFNLLDHGALPATEINQSLEKEIVGHWSYWNKKFIEGRVTMAQNSNALIYNSDAVLQALRKSADGLLLIDKRLKRLLRNTDKDNSFFNAMDEFIIQVEKFLARGNHIQITETGLLKDLGGIVLLDNASSISSGKQSFTSNSNFDGFLF